MYQSSTRNNFLDILLDPMAIAILGSIALHAIIAANFALFTPPVKPDKKAEPGTVKVVELTPNELQRIPQAPQPVIPQTLPPVYQPSTPIPPRTPQISTAPQTIPSSPVRTPPKAQAKPSKGTKEQPAKPQPQPSTPLFDPNITFSPTPTPSKPPAKQGDTTKPSPQPSQPPVKPAKPTPLAASPKPQPTPGTDEDGSEQAQTQPQPTTPTKPSQKPTATPQPSGTASPTPGSQPSQPSGTAGGDGSGGGGVYGQYTQAANDKLREYLTKYPTLKTYSPKLLSQKYPPGVPCTKVKQPPFIVLMVAFDKIPPGQHNNILGSVTAPLLENEKPYISGDPTTIANKKLLELATDAGFNDATTADKNRPEADKGKPVLYQYRVQFDPASCKH
jgi:hypothetical protein